MAIPTKIHYCWFGDKKIGSFERHCVKTWESLCPNYEIVFWNENNSPIYENDYVRQAYESKKWAFVSDYVRLNVLYTHGGIYLDTDVELVKSLDNLLSNKGFIGFENTNSIATCIIGCEAKHDFLKSALEIYNTRQFKLHNGEIDTTTNVYLLTKLFNEFGLQNNGYQQNILGMEVYPEEYFSPKSLTTGKIKLTSNTYAVHHFHASWMTTKQRINTKISQLIGPKLTNYIKRKRNESK